MARPTHRIVLVILLMMSGGAFAQPVPPSPPAAPPHHHPAHHTTHPAPPVVKAKPGAPARKVAPVAPPAPAVPAPAPAAAAASPDKDAEPSKGSNTGSPLPRFATLRSDDVNLRSGPGTRYPIDWVYKRRDLPVVIEREFDMWRLVRDPDGIKGWVNQATLAPRRSGVVTGPQQTMRGDPADTATAVAVLKAGVIVRLRSCEATSDWCQVSAQDYRGWLRRTQFWGTLPGEVVQ